MAKMTIQSLIQTFCLKRTVTYDETDCVVHVQADKTTNEIDWNVDTNGGIVNIPCTPKQKVRSTKI